MIIEIGILLVCIVAVVILWFKYGKDKKTIETVEFTPPNGLNSLEMAYILKGTVSKKDVMSLLIILANKGYLKIVEDENFGFLNNKKYKIIRKKEYDGNNEYEKMFFQGLFQGYENEVTQNYIYNEFKSTIDDIKDVIYKSENLKKVYNKKSIKIQRISFFIMVVEFVISIIFELQNYYVPLYNIFFIILQLFVASPFFVMIFELQKKFTTNRMIKNVFITSILLVCIAYCRFIIGEPEKIIWPIYLLENICIIFTSFMEMITVQKNEDAVSLTGRIRGYKNFLANVEKEKFNKFVKEDPQSFYEILPYMCVFGISDKWLNEFKISNVEMPDWLKK